MMARQVANNLEQLYWYGNTLGPAIAQSEWPVAVLRLCIVKILSMVCSTDCSKQAEVVTSLTTQTAIWTTR